MDREFNVKDILDNENDAKNVITENCKNNYYYTVYSKDNKRSILNAIDKCHTYEDLYETIDHQINIKGIKPKDLEIKKKEI